MKAKDFRARALSALKGHWGVAIAVTLVAIILGGAIASPLGNVTFTFRDSDFAAQEQAGEEYVSYQIDSLADLWRAFVRELTPQQQQMYRPVIRAVNTVFSLLAGVLSVLAIVRFVIGGAVSFGHARFHLGLQDGKEVCFNDLFSEMGRLGKGIGMKLLMTLYLVLWTLLFIVPGIIKSFSYAMTAYILTEHPEMKVNDAITLSRQMMKGNKWRLFCLDLSFIGWALLCVLTLGIGNLWLNPYIENAHAAFYREVSQGFFGQQDTTYIEY